LPLPFDNNTQTTVEDHRQFFTTYGAHYVRQVVIGAKHIYATVMKALDVMELSNKNIDVTTETMNEIKSKVDRAFAV
jgi:methyl-accepting chemotaxis protein